MMSAFPIIRPGAKLVKNGKEYNIPREFQHEQAHKAHLDYDPDDGLLSMKEYPKYD